MLKSFQLISLSLCTITSLYAIPNLESCGLGYNSLEGELKQSPFPKIKCKITNKTTSYKENIKIIKNYNELFQFINTPENKKFFDNYWTKKLLDNPYINDYTITLAVFEQYTLYQNKCLNKLSPNEQNLSKTIYGDSYIKSVDAGGKHLILYHIQTHSRNEYTKLLKKLKKAVKTTHTLQTYLSEQESKIIYKEYFSKNLSAIPAADLNSTFHQSVYFMKQVKKTPLPCHISLEYYQKQKSDKTAIKKKIHTGLQIQLLLNNFNYYRHHTEEFEELNKNRNRLYEIQNMLKRQLYLIKTRYTDLNLTTETILPKRYNYYASTYPIQLPDEVITLHTISNYKKIDPQQKIKIELSTLLEIKNHHNLLRVQNKLYYQLNKESKTIKKSKIVCDTYVNYPGLKLKNIAKNFGNLDIIFDFDKYTQEKQVDGTGIIKSAICGYKLQKDAKLDIYCKDIKYRKNTISLTHKE